MAVVALRGAGIESQQQWTLAQIAAALASYYYPSIQCVPYSVDVPSFILGLLIGITCLGME